MKENEFEIAKEYLSQFNPEQRKDIIKAIEAEERGTKARHWCGTCRQKYYEKKQRSQESQEINCILRYKFPVNTPEERIRFLETMTKFNEIWNLEMKKKKGK